MFRYQTRLPGGIGAGLAEAIALRWRPESERRYIIVIWDAAVYPVKEIIASLVLLAFGRSVNKQCNQKPDY